MTVLAAPSRSTDERMAAFRLANEIRAARSVLKRQIRAGEIAIATVLAAPPAWLLNARVLDFLVCPHGVGKLKAARTLNVCRINHAKTFGGLSDRQRGELVAAVTG